MDQEHWTQIADATSSESISEITVPMDAKYEGMFFRISFRTKSGLPAPAVSEFEIML